MNWLFYSPNFWLACQGLNSSLVCKSTLHSVQVFRTSFLPEFLSSHVPQQHPGALHLVLVADSCPGTGPSSLLLLSRSTSSSSLIKCNLLMNSFLILSTEDFFLFLLNPQSASQFLSSDPHYVRAFFIGLVVKCTHWCHLLKLNSYVNIY